jgi:TRAP-type C4-dicarboxylate transport system permease small subunit
MISKIGWPEKFPSVRRFREILGRVVSVIFDGFLALASAAVAWDAFRPQYGSPHLQRGAVCAILFLCFSAVTLGMALGRKWAHRCSLVGMLGMLAFCSLSFWDGYLRVRPKYSGEESSEAGAAVMLGVPTLISLVALCFTTVNEKRPRSPEVTVPPNR